MPTPKIAMMTHTQMEKTLESLLKRVRDLETIVESMDHTHGRELLAIIKLSRRIDDGNTACAVMTGPGWKPTPLYGDMHAEEMPGTYRVAMEILDNEKRLSYERTQLSLLNLRKRTREREEKAALKAKAEINQTGGEPTL